jgi:hypothetical protein
VVYEMYRGKVKLILILKLQVLTGSRVSSPPGKWARQGMGIRRVVVRAKRGLRKPEGFARRS